MANEKRLIDANALLESIEGTDWYTIRVDGSVTQGAPSEEVAWYKATDIYAAVENAPTVDAVEVVHGRWINTPPYYAPNGNYNKAQECSVCHSLFVSSGTTPYSNHPYCCECGAKMDGGNEDGK